MFERRRNRFLIGFIPTFIISLAYWPIMLSQCPSGFQDIACPDESLRWLQNNPALSVFQTVFLPLIAGILVASIEPQHLREVVKQRRIVAVALLALVILLALGTVRQDSQQALNDRVIEPLEFRSFGDRAVLLKQEKLLRESLHHKWKPDCLAAGVSAAECYMAFTRLHFANKTITLREFAGPVGWWQRILSGQAAVIGGVLAWYLLLSLFARHVPPSQTFDGIILCLSLLATWFPARLYGDWYTHFGSFERLAKNRTLVVVAVIYGIVLGATLAVRNERPLVKLVAGALSGLSAIIAAIAGVKPEAFGAVARFVEELKAWEFLTIDVTLLLFLLALLWSARVVDDTPSDPAYPV